MFVYSKFQCGLSYFFWNAENSKMILSVGLKTHMLIFVEGGGNSKMRGFVALTGIDIKHFFKFYLWHIITNINHPC